MHLFRITVHKCHGSYGISVQQKEIHPFHCFEITQTMNGARVFFCGFFYLFILKCLHVRFVFYVNICVLNKHYYFYFNEEAGQNCDCIIHWPGKIYPSPCLSFLTLLFPHVFIVYVQTLYGSLINLWHFCKIFFILFVLNCLLMLRFFKMVLKTNKHFVKYCKYFVLYVDEISWI